MASNDDKGWTPVKLYRLYHIGEGGGIETVSIVEAAEHADAIACAEEQLQTSAGELWLEEMMVAMSADKTRNGSSAENNVRCTPGRDERFRH